MKKELQEQLFAKYPKIFRQKDLPMNQTAMCWGIDTYDGWYWLIDKLCSNLQWNIDNNNKDYVIKNKIVRKLWPVLDKWAQSIPGRYNLNKKKQYNPLLYIRRKLISLLSDWRRTREFIYINTHRYPQIEAVQVKEKYGGLRFYVGGCSDAQHAVINFAESLSYRICEQCGSTHNVTQTEGWIYTLCEDCLNKKKQNEASRKN